MRSIELSSSLLQGAVSVENCSGGGLKPWRIPYKDFDLFPPNGINGKAEVTTGVRLRFKSNTTAVKLEISPLGIPVELDLVCENELISTVVLPPGETTAHFCNLPGQNKLIEIYLPQKSPTIVLCLSIDVDADWEIPVDTRLKWIAYGSSITQCSDAYTPSQTWPAIVARRNNLNLTCLGYSGNCHIEPMVARMIRDLPADLISLCLGINVYGSNSLNKRTFQAAVIGFIQIIREKHPGTPIAVMSPIWSPPRESKENAVGLNLEIMRSQIEEAVNILKEHGDTQLYYVNGLDIFNDTYAHQLPDKLHPDGAGYLTLGKNYSRFVMENLIKHS